jgi:predicted permease
MGNAVICLGGAFGVASTVKSGAGFSVKRILSALGRSVPFLTYVVMLLLNLTHITLPKPVTECVGIIGSANPFLAMFVIGVGFKVAGEKGQGLQIFRLLALRYGVAVLVALIFWFVLPFPVEVRQALVILAFSPIGSAVPPFTAELGGDVGLSSAVNSISILISVAINVVLLSVIL